MRRYLLTLSCLLTICSTAVSQKWISVDGSSHGKSVSMEVIRSDASVYRVKVAIHGINDLVENSPNGEFHHLSLGLEGSLMQYGEPALPTITKNIAIPPGTTVSACIEEKTWSDVTVGTIFPVQIASGKLNEKNGFYIDSDKYKRAIYPPNVRVGEEILWHGIRGVSIHVCPFVYYPNENRLSVLSEFVLTVEFHPKENSRAVNLVKQERNDIQGFFDNVVYVEASNAILENNTRVSGDLEYFDYLIVVNNNSILNSADLQRFRIWKAMKGFTTKVVTYSSLGGTVQDLKDYIAEKRPSGLKYVLLIGDNNSIPMGGRRSYYYPSVTIDSDYWYGCTNQSQDWMADVAVGRFSVGTVYDFVKMVNKSIKYESTPPLSDDVLLVAHKLAPDDIYGYQHCSELIRDYNYSETPSFITAFGADAYYSGDNATNNDVITAINQGVPVVNYRGYGYPSYWGGEEGGSSTYGWNADNELFYSSEATNLGSTSCAVFFSVSANTGDISASNNLLEAFTRNPNGAVAFLGSTCDGYPVPNHYFDQLLFRQLYDNNVYRLGDVNLYAHLSNLSNFSYHSMFKDNALSYICGGDPSLEIWTSTPHSFGNVDMTESNGMLTITTTQHNDGFQLYLVSEDGSLLDEYYASANTCTLPKPSGNFFISICLHNYVPHIIYYNSDAEYIQNVTFNFDAYYNTTPLEIGDGVTADVPDGPVIVKSGSKLIIKNGVGGVYIDAGFDCEKGGILEIK